MPLLVALLALVSTLLANPFRWTTYTSGSNVRDLLKTESGLWLGTSGGLVRFDPATGEFEIYNNTRGLAMNSTVGLGEDADGWIWVVAPDGRITRLNPLTGQTKVISDLQDEIFEVSAIVRVGEEMFLGANNGIYRFAYFSIVDNYRVSERVRVLGGFPTGIAVNDLAVFNGYLYAATIAGMARAPLTTEQFSAPAAWQNFTTVDGLPQNNITALATQDTEMLWIATAGFTSTYDGTQFVGADVVTQEPFEIMHTFNGSMYAAGSNSIFRFEGDVWVSTNVGQPGIAALTEMEIDGGNALVVGVADRFERAGGLRFFDGTLLSPTIAPSGLGGNVVLTVEYDALGNLWASSGSLRPGVSKFVNESWTAYTRSDTIGGHFWNRGSGGSAVADNLGGMWFGGNGCGVLYHRDGQFYSYNSVEAAGFDTAGARLTGISGDAGYCETRVGKLVTGEILITNLGSTSGRPVALIPNNWLAQGDNSNPWVYYRPRSTSPFANPNAVGEILGDTYGRFFAGGSRLTNYTFVCSTRDTPADTSDDDWDSYNPVDLEDAATTCFVDIVPEALTFAVDKQNYLWVGTPGGAYYSQGGLTGNVSSMRFICLFDLPVGLRVNDIHVDSQDNKWFATDQGVAVLDPTFTWIHVFQTSSSIDYASDLASNNVSAITSNAGTGEVWIATSDGLSRLQTPYISREPQLDEVSPYPNPFHADGSQHMFLDVNSLGGRFDELRVFTLGGRLVRELSWSQAISQGWDGRNEDGDFVAGGVYLVVATTEDGHSATGKVAVLGR